MRWWLWGLGVLGVAAIAAGMAPVAQSADKGVGTGLPARTRSRLRPPACFGRRGTHSGGQDQGILPAHQRHPPALHRRPVRASGPGTHDGRIPGRAAIRRGPFSRGQGSARGIPDALRLVKFAKHEPTREQIQQTFDLVKDFIEKTRSEQRKVDVTDNVDAAGTPKAEME